MSYFLWATWLLWAGTVALVAQRAGRGRGIFLGILLGIYTLLNHAMMGQLPGPWWLWVYPFLSLYLYFVAVFAPGLRKGGLYRALVSFPASWFMASTFLAIPWAVVTGVLGWAPAPWLPYVLGLLGLAQSLGASSKSTLILLDGRDVAGPPAPYQPAPVRQERPLRVVQITDPHLGTFMPESRLRAICERAVAENPDLILLTGDYLTFESQHEASALTRALAPLQKMPGRVFACRGNHDLEAPQFVAEAMEKNHIRLLIDESVTVQTEAGAVQLVGADFYFQGRAERLAALCARYPRQEGALRLFLLHDPGAFRHLPAGEADLVLSGHTHGGQVGLLSVGLAWTFVRGLTQIPDHGFWARGTDRLYVHRGNGHYGFPLRLGVPAEEGVLEIHRAAA